MNPVLFIIVAVLLLLPFLLVFCIHQVLFGKRSEKNPLYTHRAPEDFPGLQVEPISFPAANGVHLRGYFYTHKSVVPYRAVVVFVHGLGSGHQSYLTEINALAEAGFRVLGFDRLGTWSSGGKNTGGFYQAVLDIRSALRFLQKHPTYFADPVALVGHSWGAYAVCQTAAAAPSVKAVVAFSGFDRIDDMVAAGFRKTTGLPAPWLKPYIRLCTRLRYGKQALASSAEQLRQAAVPALILHGDADPIIPPELSITASFLPKSDAPIQAVLYSGKGHQVFRTPAAEALAGEFFEQLKQLEKQPDDQQLRKAFADRFDLNQLNEPDIEVQRTAICFLREELIPGTPWTLDRKIITPPVETLDDKARISLHKLRSDAPIDDE